jgi:hypothetical protein
MPTNDIHSHRCRSEQSSRAVLHLFVPRRSLSASLHFPYQSRRGRVLARRYGGGWGLAHM